MCDMHALQFSAGLTSRTWASPRAARPLLLNPCWCCTEAFAALAGAGAAFSWFAVGEARSTGGAAGASSLGAVLKKLCIVPRPVAGSEELFLPFVIFVQKRLRQGARCARCIQPQLHQRLNHGIAAMQESLCNSPASELFEIE